MPKADLEFDHPQLVESDYQISSPVTFAYNCAAFAIGIETIYMWPAPYGPYYWPLVSRVPSLSGFQKAYESLGFSKCTDGSFVSGQIKIAIYCDSDGFPSHVARQEPTISKWKSKCGDKEDIVHDLHDLAGYDGNIPYGEPSLFLTIAVVDFETILNRLPDT